MKLLLDTHILLWVLADDSKLSAKIRKLIINESNSIYVSLASIWEIQIKHSLHPTIVPNPKVVLDLCKKSDFEIIGIEGPEILNISSLKYSGTEKHKDPFDRLLLSTAKTYGYSFITDDSLIPYYNESCVIDATR